MSETCTNPFCSRKLELVTKSRGTRRRFCDYCRLTHWILKKAARLLAPLVEQSRLGDFVETRSGMNSDLKERKTWANDY